MTLDETAAGLVWLALHDHRHRTGSDTELAAKTRAWWEALPTTLTPSEFKAICTRLHGEQKPITPGLIAARHNENRTPKHQQGVTSQPRPLDQQLALDGAPTPPAIPPRRGSDDKLTGQALADYLDSIGLRRTKADR